MSSKQSRSDRLRTVSGDSHSRSGKFERSQLLDRPFLSQTPGYSEPGYVPRDSDSVKGLQETPPIEVPRTLQPSDGEARPSIDEIVALLSGDERNRHYQTGGRAGVFVEHARQVRDRIAGAPLDQD